MHLITGEKLYPVFIFRRKHFTFGYIVPKNLIAFNDPSPDGRIFAEAFTGTSKFLVYS